MKPLTISVIAAVALVALVVGGELLRDLASERARLTREQRAREDAARAEQSRVEERNFWTGLAAGVFDPLGLFH